MAYLEVKGYRKSFGGNEVLKGISFGLEKGEVLAVIGASGGGKTTLLRCLNFLETPDDGRLELGGEVLFDAAAERVRRTDDATLRKNRLHFGLVFQQFNLFPQYSVLGNVTLARRMLDKQAVKEEKKRLLSEMNKLSGDARRAAKADLKRALAAYAAEAEKRTNEEALALIERVGLSDKLNAYPCELSGGQCQRVAIARALALTPDVLCFDEPTSALDPELTGEVLRVIKGLKSGDRTMIIVTHEMDFARRVADKVMFIADGAVEEFGTPDEVFGSPSGEKTIAFLSAHGDAENA